MLLKSALEAFADRQTLGQTDSQILGLEFGFNWTKKKNWGKGRKYSVIGSSVQGAQLNQSNAVSHNDQRCQELPELGGGDGRSLQHAAPLSALGQFGIGGRGEAHR